MPVRSRPLPIALYVLAGALAAADVSLILVGRAPHNRIHTLLVAALIVIAVKVIVDHAVASIMEAQRAAARVARSMDERPTEPLPRVVIRGTATVAYPAITAMDPKVVEIGERIAKKINDH